MLVNKYDTNTNTSSESDEDVELGAQFAISADVKNASIKSSRSVKSAESKTSSQNAVAPLSERAEDNLTSPGLTCCSVPQSPCAESPRPPSQSSVGATDGGGLSLRGSAEGMTMVLQGGHSGARTAQEVGVMERFNLCLLYTSDAADE